MGLFEGKTPAERNKTIAALVLPLIALVVLLRMFFGGDSPPPRRPTNTNGTRGGADADAPAAAHRQRGLALERLRAHQRLRARSLGRQVHARVARLHRRAG